MDRVQEDIKTVVASKELFAPLAHSTILVTGATGLIGSMLVKTLQAANNAYGCGIKIIARVRNLEKARNIYSGLTEQIEIATSDDQPCDYIVHTASPTASRFFIEHPVETIKASVEGTMSVLETARKHKVAMVYLSSMEQYGVPYMKDERMTEDRIGRIDHLHVRSSYSESKRLCECLCVSYASEYGTEVKIARLAQTFGAGVPVEDNRMPMQFAKAVVAGRDIILHTEGKSLSNFVYLSDAISGILMILVKGRPGEAYNVCNDKETRSVRVIAELVAGRVAEGRIGVRIEVPENDMGYAPDVRMYLDAGKLRALGWSAEVDMAEGYRRLVSYIRDNG